MLVRMYMNVWSWSDADLMRWCDVSTVKLNELNECLVVVGGTTWLPWSGLTTTIMNVV